LDIEGLKPENKEKFEIKKSGISIKNMVEISSLLKRRGALT